MRKVIVHITREELLTPSIPASHVLEFYQTLSAATDRMAELYDLLGIKDAGQVRAQFPAGCVTMQLQPGRHTRLAEWIEIKLHGSWLPEEFEVEDGQIIPTISLARMREITGGISNAQASTPIGARPPGDP